MEHLTFSCQDSWTRPQRDISVRENRLIALLAGVEYETGFFWRCGQQRLYDLMVVV